MHLVIFCHSLISDWNHGNAHFLRGVASELIARGHRVDIYEPRDGWSMQNLLDEYGERPIDEFRTAYPELASIRYDEKQLDLDQALKAADLVIVHEWNEPKLVRRIGEHRARHEHYRLLFHDTHHRAATARKEMASYDISNYDGVLAFGDVIRDIYLVEGWTRRAWTWQEAADTKVFRPLAGVEKEGDLVWIGNWGDEERTAELHEFLLEPVRDLGFRAKVYGVRYPRAALRTLKKAGIEYGGWLPNYRVPEVFARYRVTVHIPRRPYAEKLFGIPTIRPFEALACGIPLVCAPWHDTENLFTPGRDYLVAGRGEEMREHLRSILTDENLARALAAHGLQTIRERHTCAHRVDELLEIFEELQTEKKVKTVTI